MNIGKNIWCSLAFVLLGGAAGVSANPASADPVSIANTVSDFVDRASAKGVAAIGTGKIALERSSSQEVKAYAQRMIDEYTDINSSLTDVVEGKKLKLADADELMETAETRMLEEGDKNSFDVAYARNQVAAHQQTIRLYQEASKLADNDIKNFATKTLPKLQQHLLMAEQLLAATAETRTDIYQKRENQIDNKENDNNEGNKRIPTTDKVY